MSVPFYILNAREIDWQPKINKISSRRCSKLKTMTKFRLTSISLKTKKIFAIFSFGPNFYIFVINTFGTNQRSAKITDETKISDVYFTSEN